MGWSNCSQQATVLALTFPFCLSFAVCLCFALTLAFTFLALAFSLVLTSFLSFLLNAEMQTDANRCKQMQTDANRCKQMQTDAKSIKEQCFNFFAMRRVLHALLRSLVWSLPGPFPCLCLSVQLAGLVTAFECRHCQSSIYTKWIEQQLTKHACGRL